jgi:hypothetical protein
MVIHKKSDIDINYALDGHFTVWGSLDLGVNPVDIFFQVLEKGGCHPVEVIPRTQYITEDLVLVDEHTSFAIRVCITFGGSIVGHPEYRWQSPLNHWLKWESSGSVDCSPITRAQDDL